MLFYMCWGLVTVQCIMCIDVWELCNIIPQWYSWIFQCYDVHRKQNKFVLRVTQTTNVSQHVRRWWIHHLAEMVLWFRDMDGYRISTDLTRNSSDFSAELDDYWEQINSSKCDFMISNFWLANLVFFERPSHALKGRFSITFVFIFARVYFFRGRFWENWGRIARRPHLIPTLIGRNGISDIYMGTR